MRLGRCAGAGGAPPGTMILSREEVLRSNGDCWPQGTSSRLKGHGADDDPLVLPRRRMGGLYQLPGADGEPFRRMLEHPEIVRRLDWMLGRGWREVQAPTPDPPMLCSYPPGESPTPQLQPIACNCNRIRECCR
jgi:hypothetical protein